MAQVATFAGDLFVAGTIVPTGITLPASAVADANIAAGAKVQAVKLQHQHAKTYAQESATTAVSEARVTHVVYGLTGTLVDFRAGPVVACAGAATITVDLLKNGTTVLTAVITLDSTKVAYSKTAAGGFSATALAVGDVLEVKITATAGGGTLGKGVFAELTLREDAQ